MLSWIPWIAVGILSYLLWDWQRRQSRLTSVMRRAVVVTGSDSGFGRALVIKLDTLGMRVFAACFSEEGVRSLRAQVSERVTLLRMDVTHAGDVTAVCQQVKDALKEGQHQGLWALVNNAGTPGKSAGPVDWHDVTDFRYAMEVNTLGMINMTLTFLPLLRVARGRIVNISSTGGRLAGPLELPYDVSQHSIQAFSDGLRRHLQLYNTDVTVHVVEAGNFRTCAFSAPSQQRRLATTWTRLSALTRGRYGDFFYKQYSKQCTEVLHHLSSHVTDDVVEAYVHAVTSCVPRLRYTVGYDARLFSLPLSYMPSALVDWLMRKLHPRVPMANPNAVNHRHLATD